MKERILFRLIRDDVVIGYEYHRQKIGSDNILIYHTNELMPNSWWNDRTQDVSLCNHRYYIDHNRKDMFTGIGLNEELLFQRDILEDDKAGLFVLDFTSDGDRIGAFVRKAYPRDRIFLSCDELSKNKIVGIEGVGIFKKKRKCHVDGCENEPASDLHSICSYHKNSI